MRWKYRCSIVNSAPDRSTARCAHGDQDCDCLKTSAIIILRNVLRLRHRGNATTRSGNKNKGNPVAQPDHLHPAAKSDLERSTIKAISWRLIPFLILAYFFSYLDRVNLGFAALTMNAELKFSPLVFSWGAGISASAMRRPALLRRCRICSAR